MSANWNDELRVLLKSHRTNRKLTQQEVSDALQLDSQTEVSRIERGEKPITLDFLQKAGGFFGFDYKDIFDRLQKGEPLDPPVIEIRGRLYRLVEG